MLLNSFVGIHGTFVHTKERENRVDAQQSNICIIKHESIRHYCQG